MRVFFDRKLIISFLFMALNNSNYIAQNSSDQNLPTSKKIYASVREFNNKSMPLIPTLFLIAEKFRIPLGIEQVTLDSIETPLEINLRNTTLSKILDECIRKSSGYKWTLDENTIFITGRQVKYLNKNLFSFRISKLSVENVSLHDANSKLRISFIFQNEKPSSLIASFPGSPQLIEGKRISINVTDTSIRSILNKLVGDHGGAIWISRVAPESLSMPKEPNRGLWLLIPIGTPFSKQIFEPPLSENTW